MGHLFLTGGIGVGKSTLIRRTVELLGVTPGGFLTYYGPDRASPQRRLYLRPAWEGPVYDEAHAVAAFRNGRPQPRDEVFDVLGTGTLTDSFGWAELLLMDECGRLEAKAAGFRASVLSCLDGPIPILGVIKPDWEGTWMAQIVRHPAVCVFRVDAGNRDNLPNLLAGRLSPQRKKSKEES